jgi:aspartate carbamoyltransferase catalytic subunit
MCNVFEGWPHVIESQQFTREWLEKYFFPLTNEMRAVLDHGGCNDLVGKKMVALFYEPSTRTRASCQMAMEFMGGRVVFATENAREFSSAKKGETIQDTIRVFDRFRPDVIVLRYDKEGGAKIASDVASNAVIINAGDGSGQHPTQALLDIYTIQQQMGHIDGIKIAMVGDLINGRTVRSLSYLLGKFSGVKIYFVSPWSARMKDDVKGYLTKHSVQFEETIDLRRVAGIVDVIYQTRTQKERGTVIDSTNHDNGCYCTINSGVAIMMKPDSIIMHPLPRCEELSPMVDNNVHSVYLTHQIDSSLLTKMALLKMVLTKKAKK